MVVVITTNHLISSIEIFQKIIATITIKYLSLTHPVEGSFGLRTLTQIQGLTLVLSRFRVGYGRTGFRNLNEKFKIDISILSGFWLIASLVSMSRDRVPVASSLMSRLAHLGEVERREALSMLVTIGLSYYQQCYGDTALDMNELKYLHG